MVCAHPHLYTCTSPPSQPAAELHACRPSNAAVWLHLTRRVGCPGSSSLCHEVFGCVSRLVIQLPTGCLPSRGRLFGSSLLRIVGWWMHVGVVTAHRVRRWSECCIAGTRPFANSWEVAARVASLGASACSRGVWKVCKCALSAIHPSVLLAARAATGQADTLAGI